MLHCIDKSDYISILNFQLTLGAEWMGGVGVPTSLHGGKDVERLAGVLGHKSKYSNRYYIQMTLVIQ